MVANKDSSRVFRLNLKLGATLLNDKNVVLDYVEYLDMEDKDFPV